MKGFSFRRLVNYARYHYVSQKRLYLHNVLLMLGVPMFFSLISRDIGAATGMSMAIYLAGALAISRLLVLPMRGRGSKVLESVVPISKGERMTFMLLNSIVLYPLAAMLIATVAVLLSWPFCYLVEGNTLGNTLLYDLYDVYYLDYYIYILVQIIISATLLINLLARRSLLLAYVIAFCGFMVVMISLGHLGIYFANSYDNVQIDIIEVAGETVEAVAITIYTLIPVVLYALSYWVLRRRQMKW